MPDRRLRAYARRVLRTSELRPADVLVPASIAVLGTLELALTEPTGWRYGVALELLAGLLLVGRRFWPLVLCPLAATVTLFMPWVGPALDDVATPILILALACYSLGRRIADLRGLLGIGWILAMFAVDYVGPDLREHDLTDVVFLLSLVTPPYVFGRITRRLAVQSALLLQAQEQVRAEAVRAERDRIARDLHDVIAHSVSAMVVQTAAAQDLVRSDPDRAGALLADVADTGRRALAETGRLLHVLRDDADELGLRPAPGLAELPDLVQRFRQQGLAVEADLPDPVPSVPAGVDVSAYRIAQEVLTNALRYAADRTVALRVALTGATLSIHASNASDGTSGVGSGLGLLGVAERVKVLGGTLRHDTTGGRFELEARLPVAGA
jgi:signal transduction histidine kinase